MDVRLGYVATNLSLDVGASHTCRLANATPARIEEIVAENLIELEQILLFNEQNGIELFRIGSSLVPLASHPANRAQWWRTFERDFAWLGRIARRSHQRLSMHPSPAGASLASVRQEVRDAAVRELLYGTRVLDLLGQGDEARIVLHVGGAAPDRSTAIESAHIFLEEMPHDARRRIAIEHDDRVWSAREVYPLAEAHGLPFVADNLHNDVLPSDPSLPLGELLRLAYQTWRALGLRPKYHLASQKPGGPRGAHADRVRADDARAMIAALPGPADLMLEAKEKDLALFELWDQGIGLPTASGSARSEAAPH